MKIITEEQIKALAISPKTCVDWVREALLIKPGCQLPAKVHVHPQGSDFITTMPCLLPASMHKFGVKVVSRVNGRKPALKSDLMLFDSKTGDMEALVETDWITAMRTGAVATLAVRMLRKTVTKTYALMGLGSIARATMLCMLHEFADEQLNVRLLRYKDQAERFAGEFGAYRNVAFTIVDTIEDWVGGADVVMSAITDAQGMIVEDLSLFRPGVLLVPIHTRGFQNCDRVFDKIFGDDYDHICGFKYFNEFKSFAELTEVLRGEKAGRESDDERIISYNYGLGLHDVYYAQRISNLLSQA